MVSDSGNIFGSCESLVLSSKSREDPKSKFSVWQKKCVTQVVHAYFTLQEIQNALQGEATSK